MVSLIEKLRVVYNSIPCTVVNKQMHGDGQGSDGMERDAFSVMPDVPNLRRSSL